MIPAVPLTHAVRLHLVVAGEETMPVEAELTYDAADPYAVTAVFHADHSTAVAWTFARDLLADGMHESSGAGDVGVWPTLARGLPAIAISLTSPSGRALLQASRDDVQAFLDESYDLVPSGRESEHLDLDSVVELLLDV